MSPKIRIASASLCSALLVSGLAPCVSSASPLLSGYGGPGAGEQEIIGSALVGSGGGSPGGGSPGGGSSGGASGGGAARSSGAAAQGAGGSEIGGRPLSGSASAGNYRASGPVAGGGESQGASSGTRRRGKTETSSGTGAEDGFAYPRAQLAADSRVLGLRSGDLLLIALIALGLAVIGFATIRIVRLQR